MIYNTACAQCCEGATSRCRQRVVIELPMHTGLITCCDVKRLWIFYVGSSLLITLTLVLIGPRANSNKSKDPPATPSCSAVYSAPFHPASESQTASPLAPLSTSYPQTTSGAADSPPVYPAHVPPATTTMPSPMQRRTAHSLLLSGVCLFISGLAWGTCIRATPYPRLALGAHKQFFNGAFGSIATGLILGGNYVELGDTSYRWMWWGMIVLGPWPATLSEIPHSWLGARGTLPIVSPTFVEQPLLPHHGDLGA